MATINELSAIDVLTGGDQLPVYDASNGDARKASLTTLLTYIQANLTAGRSAYTTQYSAPSATDFSVQITDGSDSIHLILTPAASYEGTIVLPLVGNAIDKQEILINSTKQISPFTATGNGAIVIGEPSIVAANGFFLLKYDIITTTWYRVG